LAQGALLLGKQDLDDVLALDVSSLPTVELLGEPVPIKDATADVRCDDRLLDGVEQEREKSRFRR
jgi:hypothetical protein